MRTVTCKKCNAANLFWIQLGNGRWMLQDNQGAQHRCNTDELKAVKCKYCPADDLHWAEERQEDGTVKRVLTESYGLPHACDERIAFLAKQKQEKKDQYEAIKTRVNNTPDGPCPTCKGSGSRPLSTCCTNCCGHGHFNARTRKNILYHARLQIWPSIGQYGKRPYW